MLKLREANGVSLNQGEGGWRNIMGVEMQSGGHSTVGWTESVERERELASTNIPLLLLDLIRGGG